MLLLRERQPLPVQRVKDENPKYFHHNREIVIIFSNPIQCIGGFPCFPCRNSKTECVFNRDNDGRRRITMKRKIESLEQDRDMLVQLVDTIREDDKQKSPNLLNLIRSNAPLDEIRLYLAENQTQSNNDEIPGKGNMVAPSPFDLSHRYMDINRISDIPLYKVPAHPWTSVTSDDDLVSHLISLHFTWNNCASNWVDRDLFLRDMRSRNLDSKFCSPLLVNSILTMACVSNLGCVVERHN